MIDALDTEDSLEHELEKEREEALKTAVEEEENCLKEIAREESLEVNVETEPETEAESEPGASIYFIVIVLFLFIFHVYLFGWKMSLNPCCSEKYLIGILFFHQFGRHWAQNNGLVIDTKRGILFVHFLTDKLCRA